MNSTFDVICDKITLNSIIEKTVDECPGVGVKTSVISEVDFSFEVSFSSSSQEIANRAEAVFRYLLPANALFCRFGPNSAQSVDRLMKYSLDNDFVGNSIELINKSLNAFKPEELCISFNGGKDCTALLHILCVLFVKKYPNNKLNAFYIENPETFPSLENFVQQSVLRYNLNLISYATPGYKPALKSLKSDTKIKAIFMGTRTSDLPKHVVLNECQMTDPDWPQFTRISPLLKWTYSQVWTFLRDNHVLYCSLYDRGYTSIGSANNTTPNPLLKYLSRNGETYYMPAYMLADEEQERTGRTK